MTSDQWARRCRKLWKCVGDALAEQAMKSASIGNHTYAVDLSRAAEACWWQATGDGEASYLESKSI